MQEILSNMLIQRTQLEQAERERRNGNLATAERICRELLRVNPVYFGALHTLGLILAEQNKHSECIDILNRAIIENPNSWISLTALAGELTLIRAWEPARRVLTAALNLNASEPAGAF